jgi:hypothetical protein
MTREPAMTTIPSDPMAALVHLHIEALRQEAAADRTASALRAALAAAHGRRRPGRWPAGVAVALRDSIVSAGSPRAARRGEPCPTC